MSIIIRGDNYILYSDSEVSYYITSIFLVVPISNFWWGSYYGFATGQNSVDLQQAVG